MSPFPVRVSLSDLEIKIVLVILEKERDRLLKSRNRRQQIGAGAVQDIAIRLASAVVREETRLRRRMIKPVDGETKDNA